MTTTTFSYDPSRPVINVADARLNRLLLRDPERCASVSEYAAATGIETDQVIELLGPWLDNATLSLEIWGDEIFVHTAPEGRPQPGDKAQVAPNLWERLRETTTTEYAYALWKLVRGLERSGWNVETHPNRILFGLGPLAERPYLGVAIGNTVVPVLVLPSPDALASPTGLLAEYDRAGASAVAVICDAGALDETVTAVRRWVLSLAFRPSLSVLLLEAPRFNPTLLSPDDAAVMPRAVNRKVLHDLDWTDSDHSGAERPPSGYGEL